MKNLKKVLSLCLVLVLLVGTLSITAFATSTVYVRFYVPTTVEQPDGYTYNEDANLYEHISVGLDAGTFTNAFLAIKEAARLKGETETEFVYGFDDHPSSGPAGNYIEKISGLGTYAVDEYYSNVPGQSHWYGYSWGFYVVPAEDIESFDPADPDSAYLASGYPSNIASQNGCTYIMIYEYSMQTW